MSTTHIKSRVSVVPLVNKFLSYSGDITQVLTGEYGVVNKKGKVLCRCPNETVANAIAWAIENNADDFNQVIEAWERINE